MGIGGFFKSIGKAISRPVRGVGRLARGKFKEGLGDIGYGAKNLAAPVLAATGVGLPVAAAIGAAGGGLEAYGRDASLGEGIKSALGGVARAGAGHIGGKLANFGRGGTPGIDAPIAGLESLAGGGGGAAPAASNIAGRVANLGRAAGGGLRSAASNVGSFAAENPLAASQIGAGAAQTYGAKLAGDAESRRLALEEEALRRQWEIEDEARARRDNMDPVLNDIIRRLLRGAGSPSYAGAGG